MNKEENTVDLMSLDEFIRLFEEAVETIEPGTLEAGTNYHELKAWDSLAILTLTDAVEMRCGVLLTKQDLEYAQTIEALFQSILKNNR